MLKPWGIYTFIDSSTFQEPIRAHISVSPDIKPCITLKSGCEAKLQKTDYLKKKHRPIRS